MWTTGTTNDGASTYTQLDASELSKIFAACTGFEGVAPNYLNGLKVSGTASPVSIDTGGAMVDGKPYKNDASTTIVIPTPVSLTRIDRIVARADWANHQVRLTRIAGTEGAGAPAITQTPGTTYDIKLAQVSITTGGAITVTDERTFASNPVVARQGGSATDWTVAGTTLQPVPTSKFQCGSVQWTGAGATSGTVTITFPVAFTQVPVIFVLNSTDRKIAVMPYGATLTQMGLSWANVIDGTNFVSITFYWLAVGG